jgi:hypothetical protein
VNFFLALALVTIPTTIFRMVAYYLFVAPCFIVDKSESSETKKDQALGAVSSCTSRLGYLLSFAWGLIFFIVGLFFWWWGGKATWLSFIEWLGSIIQLWLIWFCVALTFDFNPIPGVDNMLPSVNWFIDRATCGMVPLRVGRWHIERAKVHGIIRDKVEKRGKTTFFLPDDNSLRHDSLHTTSSAFEAAFDLGVGDEAELGAEPEADPEAMQEVSTSASGNGGDIELGALLPI